MIKPLNDFVLLEKEKVEEKTASGIILTEANNEKPFTAKVIAVSSGKFVEGKLVPCSVAVNDRVIFEKYAGTEVKYEGKEYCLIPENKILAIIE